MKTKFLVLTLLAAGMQMQRSAATEKAAAPKPLVQIAILLDTSNSMDGLIGQAKTQLWNIVIKLPHG